MIFAVVKDKTVVEIRPPKLACHGMVLTGYISVKD